MAEQTPSSLTDRLPSKRLSIIIGVGLILFIVVTTMAVLRFRASKQGPVKRVDATQTVQSTDVRPAARKKSARKIKYADLYSQLEGDQLAEVLKELSFNGIAFNTERRGRLFDLSVDRRYAEEAKTLLAIKGLPTGGTKGFEIFDEDQGMGATEFDKRVRFIRALSGELEKAITQFYDIESCNVQVVLPEQRLFTSKQPPVTASILFRKVPGRSVSDETVFGIIQLVANAVEGLDPINVSVIDVEGRVVSVGVFDRLKKKALVKQASRRPKVKPKRLQDIGQWLKVKAAYEQDLMDKAINQLNGILVENSFKVTITADFDRIVGGVPQVKRLATSIVVDSTQVKKLRQPVKKQIFSTVAASIGYVRGRDVIRLSLAKLDLTKPRLEPIIVAGPEVPTRNSRFEQDKTVVMDLVMRHKRDVAIGALATVLVLFLMIRIIRRRRLKAAQMAAALDAQQLQQQLAGQILQLVHDNPSEVAQVITRWIDGDNHDGN